MCISLDYCVNKKGSTTFVTALYVKFRFKSFSQDFACQLLNYENQYINPNIIERNYDAR